MSIIQDFVGIAEELFRSIRIADVLDIAFITVLTYAILSWFRETTSRSVYVGISILAIVYFLARVFDMYMTALFFQAVFAVLLVALVVVFQEDLRRLFERLATIGPVRDNRSRTSGFTHMDTLAEVAADLATKHVGGLMVIKGRQPLERHVDGGIEIDGLISKPLLDSIFDPHSMGHDGAVLIENDRVKRFAAHLPLSRNVAEIGPRGTRHSAALGLSEVSDAFVIVVSEERGRISIAEGGRMTTVASAAELSKRLERFSRQAFPRKTDELWKRMLREHAPLKAVSFLAACLCWFFFSYQDPTVQQTFVVPMEFRNVPKLLVLDRPPTQVRVTLSGREREFALLSPSALKVSLDLSNVDEGEHRLPLEAEYVKRPINLSVYSIEPRTLLLDVHRLMTAEIPIDVRVGTPPPAGFELKSAQADPKSVRAQIWRSKQQEIDRISTEPIDLSKITGRTTLMATLLVPTSVSFPGGKPPEVRVIVDVAKSEEG